MRSPITFRDWLFIVGIILLIGLCYILVEQIPFINSFLDKIRGYNHYIY